MQQQGAYEHHHHKAHRQNLCRRPLFVLHPSSSDPVKNPAAQRFPRISYLEVIQKQLRVMDLTAISLCMDNSLPILVFDLFEKDSIVRILKGEDLGTIIGAL